MWLLIPFLVLPVVEIALFIQVGGLIGLLPTLGLVVLSAVAGSWLMRQQGRAALADLQAAFRDLRDPTAPLAHGALILLAGALMVTPGFFTDSVGIALLFPAVRRWVMGQLRRRMRVTSAGFGYGGAGPATDWHRGAGPSGPVWPGAADSVRRRQGGTASSRLRTPSVVIDADYIVIDDEDETAAGDGASSRPRRPSGWTRH